MANVADVLGAEPRLSRRRFFGLALPLAGAMLAACSGASAPSTGGERIATSGALVAWPAKNQWPDLFWRAAPEVQEAYRFAVAHPDVLQYIPCCCGCVNQGHRSNADCYVQEVRADGSVVLDPMSFGRDICIGITRDVMRFQAEGRSLRAIRASIDEQWSRYGPGTNTPLPPD